jgi:hypothetical protein
MGYHVRRIDPFWKASPVVLTVAVIGALVAMFGYTRQNMAVAAVGAVVMAVGVLLATKPAVSTVLGCLGFFGGLITFVLMPNVNTSDMALWLKLVSTVLFAALYMVLMDALILVVAALYNFFAGSMGGIQLEIEPTGQTEGEG